jgi:hypothetical protein
MKNINIKKGIFALKNLILCTCKKHLIQRINAMHPAYLQRDLGNNTLYTLNSLPCPHLVSSFKR